MQKNQEVWTVKEVASFIRKSEQTVRAMVKKGDLPYKKVRRRLYFTPSVVIKMYQADGTES